MSNPNPDVNETQAAGADGAPKPEVSQEADAFMREVMTLRDELKSLQGQLRGLQGRQDKDRNDLTAILEEFNALKASGLSNEAAQQAMIARRKEEERDAIIAELAQRLDELSPKPAAGNNGLGADAVTRLLTSLEIPADDAGALRIVSEYRDDQVRLAAELGRYAAQRAARPQPAPAHAAPVPSASSVDDAETVAKRLRELQRNPTPQNARERAELAARLRELL